MDKVQTIIDLTCGHLGIPEHLLRMPHGIKGARKTEVVYARMMAMVLISKHTGLSLKTIGEEFGGRDHTTVINAKKTIPDLCDTIYQVKKEFKFLSNQVEIAFNPFIAMQNRVEEYGYAFF